MSLAVLAAPAAPALAQQRDGAAGPQQGQDAPAPAPIAPSDSVDPVRGDEITPAQQAAVEKGLAWLASRQSDDGAYGGHGQDGHVAITALAGLAFMQAGNLPGRGQYGEEVARCVDFILASCQESGLISAGQGHGPMYGHGFATLFLAEVYGMTGDERVKERLTRAIRLIAKTQNAEGGWRYQPVPYDADISVTITQVMALRAARDAGIKVEKETIDNAVRYVRNCQNADGGFSYMAHGGGGGSAYERSAAGVASLYYAGIYEGDEIDRGLTYLTQFIPDKGGPQLSHYFYGHYYGVQAMFLAGGDYWSRFYPAIREQLIARQDTRTGAWSGEVSEDYCTAMALIILQMPNRYLPVYTGKGPGS